MCKPDHHVAKKNIGYTTARWKRKAYYQCYENSTMADFAENGVVFKRKV